MAVKFGRGEVERLKKQAAGAMARVRGIREKAEESVMHVVQTVTIGGTSFLFGIVNGRFVDDEGNAGVDLFGVPVELIAGIGFHVLGFMGSPKAAQHMHNVGDGAIAAYGTLLGMRIGTKMRQNAPAQNAPAASGRSLPPRQGGGLGGLTNQQLMNIARGGRR